MAWHGQWEEDGLRLKSRGIWKCVWLWQAGWNWWSEWYYAGDGFGIKCKVVLPEGGIYCVEINRG